MKGDSLIFSFFVSKMSNSLTSLLSSERPEQITHGRSFPLSHLSDLLTVGLERSERIAHIRSFDLSEMSE